VFAANAIFSMAHGYWFLGLCQVITAAVAVVAAYSSRGAVSEGWTTAGKRRRDQSAR
jgi:hypothetical protein